jgi:hypothetical protein
MIRRPIFRFALLAVAALLPTVSAGAQGLILTPLADIQGMPAPPEFRGQLPGKVDLTSTVPAPRTQGKTGTCVSWAVTYAAGSQAARRNGLGADIVLSPAFTYDMLVQDRNCATGAQTPAALNALKTVGALPIEQFVFDAGWCGRMPTDAEKQRAARYRIKGWSAFKASDLDPVKQQLARGVPVVFGMLVDDWLDKLKGDTIVTSRPDNPGTGHAMIVVGYDDSRRAFRVQNSWGREWADGGYGWFGYDFWKRYIDVGFVID